MRTYLIGAALLLLACTGVWVWYGSLQSTISGLEGQVKEQTERAERAANVAASAVSTQLIVTKTVERVVEVKVKGDTIVQRVPVYVSQKADNGCVVTNGAVSVLNSAAANVLLPGGSGELHDAPSGVTLSTVTRTAAEWASLYWQLVERYNGLLQWTAEQGALCRGGGGAAQK